MFFVDHEIWGFELATQSLSAMESAMVSATPVSSANRRWESVSIVIKSLFYFLGAIIFSTINFILYLDITLFTLLEIDNPFNKSALSDHPIC